MRKLITFITTVLISATSIAQTMVFDTTYVVSYDSTVVTTYDTTYLTTTDTTWVPTVDTNTTVIWQPGQYEDGGFDYFDNTLLGSTGSPFIDADYCHHCPSFNRSERIPNGGHTQTHLNLSWEEALANSPTFNPSFDMGWEDTILNNSFSDLDYHKNTTWLSSDFTQPIYDGAIPVSFDSTTRTRDVFGKWTWNPAQQGTLFPYDEVKLTGKLAYRAEAHFYYGVPNFWEPNYVAYISSEIFDAAGNNFTSFPKDTLVNTKVVKRYGGASLETYAYGTDVGEYWDGQENIQSSPSGIGRIYTPKAICSDIPFELNIAGPNGLVDSDSFPTTVSFKIGHTGEGITMISDMYLTGYNYTYDTIPHVTVTVIEDIRPNYELVIDTITTMVIDTTVTTDLNILNTEPKTIVDCFSVIGERIDCSIINQVRIVLYSDGSRELQIIK